ncbi:hypothetical protein CP533_6460, partial [Ophiocordyceps camponoti-saundersi (nom. inval.)]
TIPIFAQAANIYGRRNLTLLSVCLFAIGSGLCAGAGSTDLMIAGRAVQGVGGGGILTMSEIVVCDTVSVRERGLYAGLLGAIWAVASVVAPILGGAFAQGSASWRWIFYLNLPIAGLALLLLLFFLHLRRPPSGSVREQLTSVDWGGFALLVPSVAAVVLALGWGSSRYAWSSWRVVLPLASGLSGLVCFFVYQASPWLREPTMPLRIFTNRASALCLAVSFLHSMLLFWACYFLPVYFQAVLEASPRRSAVMLFPIATTSAPAGVLAGILITRTGRYRVWHLLGLGLMAIGCGLCSLLDASSSTGHWVGFQLLLGLGFGFVFTSTLPPILSSLPEADVATATGAWTFLRNFGSVWGIAIPGAIFNTVTSKAARRISDAKVRRLLVDGGAYEHATRAFMRSLDANPSLKAEVIQVYVDGLRIVWQASIAFAVLAFALALFVPTLELRRELETEYGLEKKGNRSDESGDVTLSERGSEGSSYQLIRKTARRKMDWTRFHNIIAGKPRGADTTRSGISPQTEQPLWPVPVASSADVDDCVAAAREAQPSWSRQTYESRVLLLERFAQLYLDHAADFSKLLARECGRTVENAAIEVSWAAQWLRYPSSFLLPEERLEDESKVVTVRHEPLGVVAAICPWNFPIMLAIGKIAPALATVPSLTNEKNMTKRPFTPYTALKLVELAQQVFPSAVLQALSGDELLGPMLVRHPGVDKISFTGSSATGKEILKAGADQMKRITLETAGNNAAVILGDVDLESVCPRIAAGLWFNAGQVCIAPRRLYIYHDIFDDFVTRLASATADLTRDLTARIGPVQNHQQLRRLTEALNAAADDHDFVSGGPRKQPDGLFLQPTICIKPPADSRLLREENFGPIVCCVPFESIDEAVRLANDVDCGLAASVWAADADAAASVASRLEAGSVFVNGPCRPDPCVPFGGHKQSGLGVEYGLEGLLSYCQSKAIYVYK